MTADAWHASGLTAVLRCGEAYRRRWIEKEGRPPVTAIIRGAAMHRAIASTYVEKLRIGETPTPELAEDIAAAEVDRARMGGATLTDAEMSQGVRRTFGLLKDEAVAYAGAYARIVAPAVQPAVGGVERRITVEGVVPGITLVGTLDLVADDGTVRDAKSAKRAPRSDQADTSLQLTMYSLLRSAETKQPAARVALDVMVREASSGHVKHHPLESTRSTQDIRALVARITAASSAVKAGVFLPANPETDWWCSAKWCEFHSTCPFAQGR